MTRAAQTKYWMSFSVGGLMVREGMALAQEYRLGETWAEARERLVSEGVSTLPKLASQTRVLREIFDRIGHLTEAERSSFDSIFPKGRRLD